MAKLLLTQVGAAALSSLKQKSSFSIPPGGPDQKSSKNLFSIADHIGENMKDDENREDNRTVLREEERESTKTERSRSSNETRKLDNFCFRRLFELL